MKILISGNNDFYTIGSSFKRAFDKLGHETYLFADENMYWRQFHYIKNRYTHRLFWKFFSLDIQNRFLQIVNDMNPDFVIIIKGWFFSPKTIREIKSINPKILVFNWNPDNPFISKFGSNRNSWVTESIPLYDAYFSYAKYLVKEFANAGAKFSEWIPCACDEMISRPQKANIKEKKSYTSDVAFVGNWDVEREFWLNNLFDYDLKIWGTSLWKRANSKLRARWQGREAIGSDYAKVCSSSKIMLNILRKQNLTSHNMKSFEIIGCKGFALMTRSQEHEEFFEEGKEAAYFSTPEELRQKVNFFLTRGALRKRIAEAGYKKIITNKLNYETRAKEIISIREKLNESQEL